MKDPKHPLHDLIPPIKVSHSQMVLRPTYPYQVVAFIKSYLILSYVLRYIWCALLWLPAGFRGVCYMKQLILAAAVVTLSSMCALILTIAIALLMDHTGHAMSWFSNTPLLVGLYVAPTCCIILSTCVMAKKYFYEVPASYQPSLF